MPNKPQTSPASFWTKVRGFLAGFRGKAKAFFGRIGKRFQTFPNRFSTEFKRWYSFNKQTIPLIFILLAGFFFTAFLDFTITRDGELAPIIFQSHINAIIQFVSSPLANLSGFFLFAIYLIAIIQMFNGFTFAKKQAPKTLLLITGLTVVQTILVTLYTLTFFQEAAARPDYVIDEVAVRSYSIMITGGAILALGTVFAWFYVDWHYVQEIED